MSEISKVELSDEELSRIAIRRAIQYMDEGTSRLNANGKAMNQNAKYVPSYTAPRIGDSGYQLGEYRVHSSGLNDVPDASGYSISVSVGNGQSQGTQRRYWLDREDLILHTVDTGSRNLQDSNRLHECSLPETVDVMDEVCDILEAALHPERRIKTEQHDPVERAGKHLGSILDKILRR